MTESETVYDKKKVIIISFLVTSFGVLVILLLFLYNMDLFTSIAFYVTLITSFSAVLLSIRFGKKK